MSNWRAILSGPSVCTSTFIDCHCCAKRLELLDGHLGDEQVIQAAHEKGWTVKTGIWSQSDGQTLCPSCIALSDEEAFKVFFERLKKHYLHHELCSIWGEARREYHAHRTT